MGSARTKAQTRKIRKKRGDTLVGTVEKKYGINLKVRSDKRLSTALRDAGAQSLSELIKMADATKTRKRS